MFQVGAPAEVMGFSVGGCYSYGDLAVSCGAGEVAMGLQVRLVSGRVLAVGLRCARVDPATGALSMVRDTGLDGYTGWTLGDVVRTDDCPAGSVLTQVEANYGDGVAGLRGMCRALMASTGASGAPTALPWRDQSGSVDGFTACPVGRGVVSLAGTHGGCGTNPLEHTYALRARCAALVP